MNNACIGVQGGTGHHRRLIEVSEVLWLVHKVLDPWTSKNKGKLPVKVVKPPTHKEKRTSSVQRKPGSKVPKGAGQPMSRAMPTSLAQKRLVKQVEREASKVKDETSSTKPYASSQSHPFTTRHSATYGAMWQGCFSAYSSKKVNYRWPFGFFGVVKNATAPNVASYSRRIATHGSAVHRTTGGSICHGKGSGKNGIPTLRRALCCIGLWCF